MLPLNNGVLTITNAGHTTTFNGTIGDGGGNNLTTINVGTGTAILNGLVVKATNTHLTHANSVLQLGNGTVVTGAIDNTQGAVNGTLTFLGAGDVTGAAGGAGLTALATVSF